LEQYVRGADHVDALGAGVADQRVADRQPVAAEVARYARGVADGDVVEGGADHFLAVLRRVGDAHRIVGRLVVRAGRRLLALDVDGAEGVLGEGQAADGQIGRAHV